MKLLNYKCPCGNGLLMVTKGNSTNTEQFEDDQVQCGRCLRVGFVLKTLSSFSIDWVEDKLED